MPFDVLGLSSIASQQYKNVMNHIQLVLFASTFNPIVYSTLDLIF